MRLHLLALASSAMASLDIRLMTYNIRLAAPSPSPGEKPWSIRQPLLSSQLNYETASRRSSLVCLQEATYPQLASLHASLGPKTWSYVGVGRDDGAKKGEFSPVFYRPEAWDLEDNATYWLSETPHEVGSVGWDAALPRIATVARFRSVAGGERFVYMCTHFDHQGQTARVNSARLIVNLTDEWASFEDKTLPVFAAGDLNVTPENEAYRILAEELHDVKDVVPEEHRFGNEKTFTGFTVDEKDDTVIDHMFVRDAQGLEFVSFAVGNARFDDGIFISDHRPVVVDLTMEEQG